MADIKISMLSKVSPVKEGMIIPMSYSPENNNVYKSGAITTDDVKSFVVKDLHLTYSTKDYVDTAISNALTGGVDGVQSIFASISYVTSEDQKLSNRINTLETIDHSVYALKSELATVEGKINNEVAAAPGREAQVLSDAKSYVTTEIGKLNVGQYATLSYVQTVANKVDSTEAAITILNGGATVEGSVKKQVADAIAGVVASAPENFDTLKEIADFIAGGGGEAASLVNRISAVETAIDNEVNTNAPAREAKVLSDAKSYVVEKIAEIPKVDLTGYATEKWVTDKGYATATALQEVGTLASEIKSSYVAADTALAARIGALETESDKHAAASVVNELSTKVSKIETAYVAADTALAQRVGTLETESAKHAAATTVENHINNGTIHVTADDKTKWNGAAAQTALDAAIARIAALETKLAQYDKRFGWNENIAAGGEWGVNFLQID